MPTRRFVLYVFAYLGAVLLYYFFIGWFAQLLLIAMAILPAVSILFSLPGMLTAKVRFTAPEYAVTGGSVELSAAVESECSIPFGETRISYRVFNVFTGDEFLRRKVRLRGAPASETVTVVNTDKSGCVVIQAKKVRVYDFLGLISIRKKPPESAVTAVLPAYPSPEPEDVYSRENDRRLVPKRGGGFSEEYELREYQPGDSVTSIHWKLTSKLGKPVIREAMIPEEGELYITVEIDADPETSVSHLYWLCGIFVERGREFTLCWGAEDKTYYCAVGSTNELNMAMARLMSLPAKEICPMNLIPGSDGFIVSGGEVKRL